MPSDYTTNKQPPVRYSKLNLHNMEEVCSEEEVEDCIPDEHTGCTHRTARNSNNNGSQGPSKTDSQAVSSGLLKNRRFTHGLSEYQHIKSVNSRSQSKMQ